MLINISGIALITSIHFTVLTPPRYIRIAGWITSSTENTTLSILDGDISDLFIAVLERMYAHESYVVHKNIIDINPYKNKIK